MKKLLILSSELLTLALLGFFIGNFLDEKFLWGGWATIFCLIGAYLLWFLNFYKNFR